MGRKILYVITKSNFGGAQRNVFDLATAMKEHGFEVVVALGGLPAATHAAQAGEGLLKQKLETAGVRTLSIESLGRDISATKDAGSFGEIFSIIKRERPDIMHLHSPKAAGLGALAARLFAIRSTLYAPRIIYTVHGWAFNEDRPLHQRAAIVFFSWLTMLLCHKTILLSQREYNQALTFPFVKNKLALIPLGIKSPVFLSANAARKEMGTQLHYDISKCVAIGTIAELHPNKGLTYLINAMAEISKKYPHVMCVIVGEGQEKASLELLANEKGLKHIVRFAGYIDEASKYLKAFDVFVLPSVKEGLPYVLLEAGLASLPVIATSVGGIPEIVKDKKSGLLVQPKNPSELASALSFMVTHLKERTAFGSAIHAHVKSQFSFEKMLSATKNLYKSP